MRRPRGVTAMAVMVETFSRYRPNPISLGVRPLMAQVRRTHGLHANPFQLFPRVIVSMAWLPQVRAQRLLRDVYTQATNPKTGKRYAFDILVVDEAHHVAPSSPSAIAGGRGYAVDTQRTVAVRQLAEKCEHRLFLSATPHDSESGPQ